MKRNCEITDKVIKSTHIAVSEWKDMGTPLDLNVKLDPEKSAVD